MSEPSRKQDTQPSTPAQGQPEVERTVKHDYQPTEADIGTGDAPIRKQEQTP